MTEIVGKKQEVIEKKEEVVHNVFRKANEVGFAIRNRKYASNVNKIKNFKSPYSILPASISFEKNILSFVLIKTIYENPSMKEKNKNYDFLVKLTLLKDGPVHISIDEKDRSDKEISFHGTEAQSKLNKSRFNDALKWTIENPIDSLLSTENVSFSSSNDEKQNENETYTVNIADGHFIKLFPDPFKLILYYNHDPQLELNSLGFLNLEHYRPRPSKTKIFDIKSEIPESIPNSLEQNSWEVDVGCWEEKYFGFTDSKPRGPESVALDISFSKYDTLYGLAEHADRFALRDTIETKSDPYRFYNGDIPTQTAVENGGTVSTYGTVPLIQAHKKHISSAVFWLNSSDTWVDIHKYNPDSISSHFFSECGTINLFLFATSGPAELLRQYTQLTGRTPLPNLSYIGYHQCRFSYGTQKELVGVPKKLDEVNVPVDVMWLDIDYTDGKRYFTWNKENFPSPEKAIAELAKSERKIVTIIDPHIKVEDSYPVYKELMELINDDNSHGAVILNKYGKPYIGNCWPGDSVWVDFFDKKGQEFWASWYHKGRFCGDAINVGIWNDMNEVSDFSGVESTFPRDLIIRQGWEWRDVHNLYGLANHSATYEGLKHRNTYTDKSDHGKLKTIRPFILSRSFHAGSQKYAAVWTGDNSADWNHLKLSISQILSLNICGVPFCGSDVGGFINSPQPELLVRWYQAGAFYPFYREHANSGTDYREPYLYKEPILSYIRNAIKLRYTLTPEFYTAFFHAHISGAPIILPMALAYPGDSALAKIDTQFYLGGFNRSLLVAPVTTEGATSVDIYIPSADEIYYTYDTYVGITGRSGFQTFDAPLGRIPILARGGAIITRKDSYENSRSLLLGADGSFTLVIYLDLNQEASGSLYFDDYISFEYESGEFIYKKFTYEKQRLKSCNSVDSDIIGKQSTHAANKYFNLLINKVIIVGENVKSLPNRAVVTQNGRTSHHGFSITKSSETNASNMIIVENLKIHAADDWELTFSNYSFWRRLSSIF